MTTITTAYENTHGRKPKGTGNWALRVTGTNGRGAYTSETYFLYGPLPEAKREATRRMKLDVGAVKTVTAIEILP